MSKEAEIARIQRIFNLTYSQATRYVESVQREAEAGRLVTEVTVVPNQACPGCGEDGSGKYPNRPKVQDHNGWWWRCYNPSCQVLYYNPETGDYDHDPEYRKEEE